MARIIIDCPQPYTAAVNSDLEHWADQARTAAGLDAAAATAPLTAEASHRRFYRQSLAGGGSVIVMDSPPALERNDAFTALAEVFAAAGLPVPRILAQDKARGWLLLSDLGGQDLKASYDAGAADRAVETALRWLLRWRTVRHPAIEPYSGARLHMELGIFSEWLANRAIAAPLPSQIERDLYGWLIESARSQPAVCVHRDWHCRNLLLDDAGRFGIVDFQDALHGPLCYDLASLLHDCYHRFDDDFVRYWRAFYRRQAAPDISPGRFARMTDAMAIQRQLKAVGIFARLQLRDGKGSHRKHIAPTVESLLALTERYPQTAALHRWLQHQQPTINQWAEQ